MLDLLFTSKMLRLCSPSVQRTFSLSCCQLASRKAVKFAISDRNYKDIPIKGTFEYKLRQMKDPYVKKRREEGYRCRSAYKLKEINDKHKILTHDMKVLDLGCAPGSWCQVLTEYVFKNAKYEKPSGKGVVVGVDLIKLQPMKGATFIQGDFTSKEVQKQIVKSFMNEDGTFSKINLVVSDAAPNASGVKAQDAAKLSNMIRAASRLALNILETDGTFLFKVWYGPEAIELKKQMSSRFGAVEWIKPPSSRTDSTETYIICKHYRLKTSK